MRAEWLRTRFRRGTRARWALTRGLVSLGALLLFVAFQLPWASYTVTSESGTGPAITWSLGGGLLPSVLALRLSTAGIELPGWEPVDTWAGLVWYGVPVLGFLLALALWQRTSARLALVTRWLYHIWLVAMSLLTVLSAWLVLDTVSLAERNGGVQIERTGVDAGMWLALAALALLWIGMYLMLGEPHLPGRAGGLAAPRSWRRTRTQLVAFGTLLAGVLLWGLGYVALPWATANCAPRLSLTHYVDGFCAGLDSGDTLSAFVSPHLASSASVSIFAGNALLLAFVLLCGSAPLLVAGAARSAYRRGFCGWVLAWLVVATVMALLSYRGVSSAVANPPFAVGPWHGDVGIVLTFVGLLCAWASLIPLEAGGLALSISPTRAPDNTRALAVDMVES